MAHRRVEREKAGPRGDALRNPIARDESPDDEGSRRAEHAAGRRERHAERQAEEIPCRQRQNRARQDEHGGQHVDGNEQRARSVSVALRPGCGAGDPRPKRPTDGDRDDRRQEQRTTATRSAIIGQIRLRREPAQERRRAGRGFDAIE